MTSTRRARPTLHSIALALIAISMSVSCGGDTSDKPQPELPTVTLRSGAVEMVAEVARSDEEQRVGLMFRKSLADGRGMIFVYDDDRRLSFWMKNTLVPLTIAFLAADGTIREIRDMEPGSLATVDSARFVRYALEAPRGWFGRVGLAVGDRFELPAGFPGPAR